MQKYFVVIVLSMFLLTANGQFRIKAGLTYSNISTSSEVFPHQYSFGMNYMFGVEYNFMAGNLVGIETGINHFRLKNEGNGSLANLYRSYLAVPIVASLKPKSFISPGIGVLLSSKVSNDKVFEPVKSIDVSALAKVAIRPFEHIALEIGYNLGFIPFVNFELTGPDGIPIGTANLKNKFYFLRLSVDL